VVKEPAVEPPPPVEEAPLPPVEEAPTSSEDEGEGPCGLDDLASSIRAALAAKFGGTSTSKPKQPIKQRKKSGEEGVSLN
jgi:hypothetical protein